MGIVEDLIEGQIRIEQKLDELLKISQKSEFVTIKDIAKELDKSREWVSLHPWVQPNNGNPDLEGKPKKWLRESWDEWKKNLPEHKRRWPKIIRIA